MIEPGPPPSQICTAPPLPPSPAPIPLPREHITLGTAALHPLAPTASFTEILYVITLRLPLLVHQGITKADPWRSRQGHWCEHR